MPAMCTEKVLQNRLLRIYHRRDSRGRQLVCQVSIEGGYPMRVLTLSAAAISALSVVGFADLAQAQQKLFIYADMERGNQAGAPPACVLNNVFLHLEKVVWRVRVQDQTGKVLDDKGLKSVIVEMQDGQKLEARFGGHPPRQPTDYLWAAAWIIPANYPTGTFEYKLVVTDQQGSTQTWEPFKVATSQLRILDGAIELKKTN